MKKTATLKSNYSKCKDIEVINIETPEIESDIIKCKTCGEYYCNECNDDELIICSVCNQTVCISCITNGKCADCQDKNAKIICYRCNQDLSEIPKELVYKCEECGKYMCENCYVYDDDTDEYICSECFNIREREVEQREREEEEERRRDYEEESRRIIPPNFNNNSVTIRTEENIPPTRQVLREIIGNATEIDNISRTGDINRRRNDEEPGWEVTDTW